MSNVGLPVVLRIRLPGRHRERLLDETIDPWLLMTGPNVSAESPVGALEYASPRPIRLHSLLVPAVQSCLTNLPIQSRVIDLGCGNGYLSGQLLDAGYSVTGVDVSRTGIRHAASTWPTGDFRIASVTDPDLVGLVGDGFAAAVACEVIEHLYSPEGFLKNCHKLLARDGLLVITTPYHGYAKNCAIAMTGRFDRHVNPRYEGGHIKFWSRRTLTAMLEDNGFRVTAFQGLGRVPYLWKSMLLAAVKIT